MHMLLCGYPPFTGSIEEVLDRVQRHPVKIEKVEQKGGLDAKSLILRIMDKDPKRRMAAKEVLEHDFLVNEQRAHKANKTADMDSEASPGASLGESALSRHRKNNSARSQPFSRGSN
mmetsp:Transcript_69427/g.193179  ORF Transcript_69427/g.193179 Transcript_69427/m.193179 type:complete len:117 (-) Transcript_69427:165-515(-)